VRALTPDEVLALLRRRVDNDIPGRLALWSHEIEKIVAELDARAARIEALEVENEIMRDGILAFEAQIAGDRQRVAIGGWVEEHESRLNFGVGSSEANRWVGAYRRRALAAGDAEAER
jgi:hypothetical protein